MKRFLKARFVALFAAYAARALCPAVPEAGFDPVFHSKEAGWEKPS